MDLWVHLPDHAESPGKRCEEASAILRVIHPKTDADRLASAAEIGSRGGPRGGSHRPFTRRLIRGKVRTSRGALPPTRDADPTRLITVALLVQPPVLRSLLATLLATDPAIRVVEAEDGHEGTADVVVLSQTDPENEAVPISMLLRSPNSRVLALGDDARRAVLYELRPHRTALGELSRDALLAAVHGPGEVK